MSSDTITLNIALSPDALRKQATMLGQMANVLEMLPEAKKKSAGEEIIRELDSGNDTAGASLPAPPPTIPAAPVVSIANAPQPPTPPAAQSQAAQTPGIVGEVDKEGLPWDGRIHSSSKALTKTGTWKVARNMDPKKVVEVRAELIALRDAAKGGALLPTAPAPAAPVAAIATPPAPPPFVNTLTGLPPAPLPPAAPIAAPPAPPAPVVEAPVEDVAKKFTSLLQYISGSVNDKRVTAQQVNDMLTTRGIPQLGLLGKRPDLFDTVRADMDAIILQNQIAAVQ